LAEFVVLDVTPGTRLLLAHVAGGCCAKCGCSLLEEASGDDPPTHLGECAHIRGERPGAARFDSLMTHEERRHFNNLIYLDGRCHTIVDDQESTYTVQVLSEMKAAQWRALQSRITNALPRVNFPELKVICDAIVSAPMESSEVSPPTHPVVKMRKNGIETPEVDFLVRQALGSASVVREFVGRFAQLDQNFPERLRAGFVAEFNAQHAAGLRGDALFVALHSFAASHSSEPARQAAALSVLGYLFEACEVFEP